MFLRSRNRMVGLDPLIYLVSGVIGPVTFSASTNSDDEVFNGPLPQRQIFVFTVHISFVAKRPICQMHNALQIYAGK